MGDFTVHLALTGIQGFLADDKSGEERRGDLYVRGRQRRGTTGEPGSQGVGPG